MKSSPGQTTSADSKPLRWILGSLTLATLYFQSTLADPFNSPKLWVLLIFSAWLVGFISSNKNIVLSIKPIKHLSYLILVFLGSLLLSSVFTDFRYVAFFGDTQRRNGFLTYLSLSIILISSALFIRTFNIKQLFYITYLIATIFGTYAFMQSIGKDFVEWNNPYNSIVGTVGNPNFSAAVMAVMGVLILSSTFISSFSMHFRIFGGILALALLGLIYKSDALQGLLSYAIGISLFLLLLAYKKNKKLGIVLASSGVMVFLCGVLGMLQIGPLERFLYKPSVSVRGYYWRAGLEMFKDNPIFGVGMDRYGAYFKQYREVGYPLNYGFEITSTNAHNTFIQFFATGGVFLGTTYLVLNSYIAWRAIIGLKNQSGSNRLLLAGVFSAWVAFHAQSLVSIDNIGISIWGWILGGSIIGISISSAHSEIDDKKPFFIKHIDINFYFKFSFYYCNRASSAFVSSRKQYL
jgi:O-antigen ligase